MLVVVVGSGCFCPGWGVPARYSADLVVALFRLAGK